MITKYTSVYTVISKVLSDLDLPEGTHRINDLISWSAEALEKIGAFPYFEVKTTGKDGESLLELTDYQVPTPMGCHNILQIAYGSSPSGPYYPMRYGTGSMDYNKMSTSEPVNTDTVFSESDIISVSIDMFNLVSDNTGTAHQKALAKLNTEADTKSLIISLLNNGTKSNIRVGGGEVETDDITYVVNGGYIKCNRRSGYLMVVYQAIPLDEAGYPLIPDNASFLDAIYWYIVMKLYYPEWKQGTIRDAVYYDARRSWNYYCKQAYGNALMPNHDEMEAIKNTWIRLIPDMESHKTFYTKQGQREQIYNQDSPRYNSYYEKVFYSK
jgi:hypothetical protein